MKWSFLKFTTPLVAALAIAFPAAAQFGEEPDFTITPAERTTVIEKSIARLNERYVYPDVAKKMEQAIRAKAKHGDYDSITSAKQLADTLRDDFRAVSHDKHLFLAYHNEVIPDRNEDPDPPPSAEDDAKQRAFMTNVNYGFEKVERMQGNVGYVEIRGFVPPSLGGPTATAAMSFIANADALIVDLRRNGGGEPAMIAFVTTYLFDEPTHLNDIYTRFSDSTQQWWTLPYVSGLRYGGKKPVYVLTSSRTFSGGEEFAYNLKNLKRATIVGETTGGGAHPVSGFKVSDHFEIGVPFARAISPVTKTNWEGTGVTPDVSIPADKALDKAYFLALGKVIEGTADPVLKGRLQELQKQKEPK